MKKDKNTVDFLYTVMVPGVKYHALDLVNILKDTIGKKSMKQVASLIQQESKSKVPRIVSVGKSNLYILNPKSYKKVSPDKVIENDETVRLARIISRAVHGDTKAFIEKWLHGTVHTYTKEIVEDIVREEIRKELIPVLLEKIDEKIKTEVTKKISKALQMVITSLE